MNTIELRSISEFANFVLSQLSDSEKELLKIDPVLLHMGMGMEIRNMYRNAVMLPTFEIEMEELYGSAPRPEQASTIILDAARAQLTGDASWRKRYTDTPAFLKRS